MKNLKFRIIYKNSDNKLLYLDGNEFFQPEIEKAFIYDNIDWAVRTLLRVSKVYGLENITIQINEN